MPGLDFSFSGVKTALLYAVRDLGEDVDERKSDLAASYEHAVVRALVERTLEAAEQTGAEQIAVVGGVAANSELRASLAGARFAPLELCTDNAAMVASAGRYAAAVPYPGYLALDVYASREAAEPSQIAALAIVALAAGLLLFFALRPHGGLKTEPAAAAAATSWTGLVGEGRPKVDLTRWRVVVLKSPSVAQRRPRRAGRPGRRWSGNGE